MSDLSDRINTAIVEARSLARIARQLPRLVSFARTNPAVMMRHWAAATPNAPALRFEDQRYTWREVNERANQYARVFADRGVRAEHVVAILMTNRPDFICALFGLNKLGAIGALINTNLRGPELVHAIDVATPHIMVVGDELIGALGDVIDDLQTVDARDVLIQVERPSSAQTLDVGTPMNDDVHAASTNEMGLDHKPRNTDIFCYIYTSGTTGMPKAARVTNQRMAGAGIAFGEAMLQSGPGECTYVSLPLYHSSAMYIGWGSALYRGGSMALARKFSASRFWQDVCEHDCTSFLYIGELCRYLLNTPPHPDERRHRLRVGVGNGLRPDIWAEFQHRFNVSVMREFYGATEGNAPVFNFEGRPGMVGRKRVGQVVVRCNPATGEIIRNTSGFCDRVQPGETGLMLGKINRLMRFDGYVNQNATSKKIVENVFKQGDRFFNSGDLLQLHKNGWLSFADRVGDTFRWKGENVSTNEVAEMLNRLDGVLEANVYGVRVPHADGRAGMAAISVEDGFDLQTLADYVTEKLPTYQRPYFVRMLEASMRTTSTFKHQKVDYRTEGFNPSVVTDPLYVLQDGQYLPIDAALFASIEAGDVTI